ncbi:3-phosphoinositide dependent protein kinase-1, partial [Tremellales sp. Uapishka_1]
PSPAISSTNSPPSLPAFPRLPQPGVQRNASTSSSASSASTTSSLVAAPIKPPPIETRTAATSENQLPSRPSSSLENPQEIGYSEEKRDAQFGGRGFMRNGPRSGRQPVSRPPSINTSSPAETKTTPVKASSSNTSHSMSPTTPRAPRFPVSGDHHDRSHSASPVPVRVTISLDPSTASPAHLRRGSAAGSNPSNESQGPPSPTSSRARPLAIHTGEDVRERRQSQASAKSSASAARRLGVKDFVLGEELGRGSYSTVVKATSAPNAVNSPTNTSRPPKAYALKIINQAHLIQEKKAKYATIERDALVLLGTSRNSNSPTARGHRRGPSSSSTGAGKRKSTASLAGNSGPPSGMGANGGRDRLSVATMGSDGSGGLGTSAPLSPVMRAGRRPSTGAELPHMVVERAEEGEVEHLNPPLPITLDQSFRHRRTDSPVSPSSSIGDQIPHMLLPDREREQDRERSKGPSKSRRQSLATSERSVRSTIGHQGHPGIIRLHSTFVDSTSLCEYSLFFPASSNGSIDFVLDLASNGELLGFIRKFGSLDLVSARYYAAQLIDTIEYMHERGVIHRDLKPENILLDEDMRIKVTDFGSAKLMEKEVDVQDDGKKRSFVGSADFVSPEVLRNEAATAPSDLWAFGCILYQFFVGKPPFRGATDYLTFQKILKREMEFPTGFDEDAKSLVESILNLCPSQRPSVLDIKCHPFFATTDFSTLWTAPAPTISSGLTPPVATLATVDPNSDIWAVFEDEGSEGGFEYEDQLTPDLSRVQEPHFDGSTAAVAVQAIDGQAVAFPSKHGRVSSTDSSGSLGMPRPAWLEGSKKGRKWSTSSSSSGNRTALSGLLDGIGLNGQLFGTSQGRGGSSRTSRTSDRSDEAKIIPTNGDLREGEGEAMKEKAEPRQSVSSPGLNKWLITVKEDIQEGLKIKGECVFGGPGVANHGSRHSDTDASPHSPGSANGARNLVTDVQEKGAKGFVVHTPSQNHSFVADTAELRNQWLQSINSVFG